MRSSAGLKPLVLLPGSSLLLVAALVLDFSSRAHASGKESDEAAFALKARQELLLLQRHSEDQLRRQNEATADLEFPAGGRSVSSIQAPVVSARQAPVVIKPAGNDDEEANPNWLLDGVAKLSGEKELSEDERNRLLTVGGRVALLDRYVSISARGNRTADTAAAELDEETALIGHDFMEAEIEKDQGFSALLGAVPANDSMPYVIDAVFAGLRLPGPAAEHSKELNPRDGFNPFIAAMGIPDLRTNAQTTHFEPMAKAIVPPLLSSPNRPLQTAGVASSTATPVRSTAAEIMNSTAIFKPLGALGNTNLGDRLQPQGRFGSKGTEVPVHSKPDTSKTPRSRTQPYRPPVRELEKLIPQIDHF